MRSFARKKVPFAIALRCGVELKIPYVWYSHNVLIRFRTLFVVALVSYRILMGPMVET